jgi:hypothetical protein
LGPLLLSTGQTSNNRVVLRKHAADEAEERQQDVDPKLLAIPTCKNTPKGGRSMAIMIRSRSIQILSVSIRLPYCYAVSSR